MTQQTTFEYNKIHALARARKLVMQKFGSDLLNYWPLSDSTPFIRDLLRKKPLIASGVAVQQAGMLDYGVGLQSGYLSDLVKDTGDTEYEGREVLSGDYYLAVPVPVGRWTGIKFRNTGTSGLTDGIAIAPPATAPSSVLSNKLLSVNTTTSGSSETVVDNTYDPGTEGVYFVYSSQPRTGQRLTLNTTVRSVSFKLYKAGSPTGTAQVKIFRASDNTELGASTTTLDVAGLTAIATFYSFEFNPAVQINNEDVRVVLVYTGGSSGNWVVLKKVTSTGISGPATFYDGSTWTDESGQNVFIKILTYVPEHSATLPFALDADSGQWWCYFKANSCRDTGSATHGINGKSWNGSAYTDVSDVLVKFSGPSATSWPSYDKFTICVLVNADVSPGDGVLLSIADANEAKARLYITSDKKAQGVIKNAGGATYTLTAPDQMHPGYNLVTLAYQRNVSVKLGVNGVIVASTTPNDNALFNTTLAIGVGAQMLTVKTTSLQLKNGVVDDIWLAKGTITDAELWDIYMGYLTAAPLMQLEDVTPF